MDRSTPISAPALNRYDLYKSGTATLLAWLLSTAASSGYGDPKNPPKNPVPVSRLLRCAKAICAKKPAVCIPSNIIELAIDVIRGRELYVELYAGFGKEDEPHQHFIDQLWAVVKVLRDARKQYKGESIKETGKRNLSGASGTSTETVSSLELDSVANMFTHLSVEEPSDEPFSSPDKRNAEKKASPHSTLATTPEEERRMALVCYLEDMVELRKYVRQLWEGYAAGDLSLDVVGTTSELAFGCMRRAEEALDEIFQTLGGNDKMDQFCQLNIALMGSNDLEGNSKKHREALLCPGAVLLANTAAKECMMFAKLKVRQKYVPSKKAVEARKGHLFANKLLSIIPDLVRTSHPIDEFATEFHEHDGSIRLLTVMMIQSYSEIYDIIGDPALIMPQALDAAYTRASKIIDNCFRVRDQVRNPFQFENLWKFQQKVEESGTFLEELRISDLPIPSYVNSEARMFKVLPVGNIERIKYLNWGMNMTASRVANDGWIVIAMSYLYRASLHYGLLTEKWEDLEWLIALQSKTRAFVLEVAEHADAEAFCRHYRISFGLQTGELTRKKINNCKQHMRTIEPLLDYPARMELESQSQDRLGYERGEMAEVVLRKMATDRFFGKGNKHIKKGDDKRFTNIELLETYKLSFIADEPEYHMDLLGLWCDMAELMKSMHQFLYPKLMHKEPEPRLCLDAQVVKPLLEEAAYYQVHGLSMNRTQIAVAAKMIEKHVRARGKFFMTQTMGMSSGHIVEESKPRWVSQGTKVSGGEAHGEQNDEEHEVDEEEQLVIDELLRTIAETEY